ncbi:MAG: nuclear transport factor 2 family protein [Planctomycetes bacterium]|nr:nuclear transport factor 2 family protein [Planctomycetota bacterium]
MKNPRKMVRGAAWAVVVLGLAGCASTPRGGDVVRELIAAGNRGDLDAVLGCYTEDVVWAPPWGDGMRGRDAIAAHYRTLFAGNAMQLEVVIEQERVVGDSAEVRALVRGRVVPRAGGAPVLANDRLVATLRREGGRYRVAHLAWQPVPPDPGR